MTKVTTTKETGWMIRMVGKECVLKPGPLTSPTTSASPASGYVARFLPSLGASSVAAVHHVPSPTPLKCWRAPDAGRYRGVGTE